jgi:hypothetical protein
LEDRRNEEDILMDLEVFIVMHQQGKRAMSYLGQGRNEMHVQGVELVCHIKVGDK